MAIAAFRATFTGVEPYVDVPVSPAMVSPAVCMQGITLDDTTGVVDYAITLISGNTVARVEPSALFTGVVDFALADV